MSHERARELLDESEEFLTSCRQKVATGEEVDMAVFEKTIQEFCELLSKMPKEDAQQYEESLKRMGSGLNDLSEILAKKRDEIKDQVYGLGEQKRAQAAYKKADIE